MIPYMEHAKKVDTFGHDGKNNGYLIELFKDGERTVAYMTCAKPGAFKGYHLHRVRAARYVCIRGKMKIIVYIRGARHEYFLDASKPQRLFIPAGIATGLENTGNEEAWLINFPDPPYDPGLKDEQVEYTQEELEKGVVK